MADWRQIQARIRKAKSTRDPSAKLSELYQRTRDAMVAWELGAIEEKAEHNDEAAKWYTIAAQRFRRADWKKKAEEALTRLGAPLPPGLHETPKEHPPEERHAEPAEEMNVAGEEASEEGNTRPFVVPDLDRRREERLPLAIGEIAPGDERFGPPGPVTSSAGGDEAGHRKRRRGRRGGRGRRRRGAGAAPGLPTQAFTPKTDSTEERASARTTVGSDREGSEHPASRPTLRAESAEYEQAKQARAEGSPPQLPSERMAHGRPGDPALASHMAHLESLLRRLVASPLHRLTESDEAPAGPGVFLLSDADQITSYYIEACQTLRVGIGNLVRGGRAGKGRPGGRGFSEGDLKAKLADHLGIGEAKVSQYLKDHCVVRWIQLDDEAPQLAHFSIAVLRTPLNLG
jgi:hypothetical protein